MNRAAQMPVFTIQRDPANFEDPDAFIPERWVEGTPEYAANKRLPGSWLAFGDGTRVCVGEGPCLVILDIFPDIQVVP